MKEALVKKQADFETELDTREKRLAETYNWQKQR